MLVYEQWHQIPLHKMKNTLFPHIFKTILDGMTQLFLDSNLCGLCYINMLVWSQTLVVNW